MVFFFLTYVCCLSKKQSMKTKLTAKSTDTFTVWKNALKKILKSLLAISVHSCLNAGLERKLSKLQLRCSELYYHICRELNKFYDTQIPSRIVQVRNWQTQPTWTTSFTFPYQGQPHSRSTNTHASWETRPERQTKSGLSTVWKKWKASSLSLSRKTDQSGSWALADERHNDEAFLFRCPSQTVALQQELFLVEQKR